MNQAHATTHLPARPQELFSWSFKSKLLITGKGDGALASRLPMQPASLADALPAAKHQEGLA